MSMSFECIYIFLEFFFSKLPNLRDNAGVRFLQMYENASSSGLQFAAQIEINPSDMDDIIKKLKSTFIEGNFLLCLINSF